MKRAAKLDGPSLRDAIAADQGTSSASPARSTSDRTATPIGKKLVIEEIKNGQLTLKATIDPAEGGKVEMNNGAAPARSDAPLRRATATATTHEHG